MNKKLVPIILTAGVVALAHNAIYFTRELSPPVQTDTDDEADEEEELAEETAALPPLETLAAEEIARFVAALPGPFRNPFLTAAESGSPGGGLQLRMPRVSGTLWSNGRRVAWIDGRPVNEGESIDGLELLRIDPKSVLFRRGDTEFEVSVAPNTASPLEELLDDL